MRLWHTVLDKYGDVISTNNGWVTVRFDGDKGVNGYEVDAPYIKLIEQGKVGTMSDTLVTNYDEIAELKGQLAELRKQLAEITHLNQAVSMLAGLPKAEEMDTLVKDGKRLDWILSDAGNYWLSSRKDIDREMEEL